MSKHVWLLWVAVCVLWGPPGGAQPVTVSQEGFSVEVHPLSDAGTAAAFYGYANDRSAAPFVQAGHSVMFFYRDPADGAMALCVGHGAGALEVED